MSIFGIRAIIGRTLGLAQGDSVLKHRQNQCFCASVPNEALDITLRISDNIKQNSHALEAVEVVDQFLLTRRIECGERIAGGTALSIVRKDSGVEVVARPSCRNLARSETRHSGMVRHSSPPPIPAEACRQAPDPCDAAEGQRRD